MALTFDTNIQYMRGVGTTRAAALSKLGITTVGQLLYHFPRGYEFRGNVKPLASAESGEVASFILTAATDVRNATLRRGMTLSKLRAFDASASAAFDLMNGYPVLSAQFDEVWAMVYMMQAFDIIVVNDILDDEQGRVYHTITAQL